MSVFDDWLRRKVDRRRGTLRAPRTVEEKFVKVYGPRGDYAWLRLTGEPAGAFDFRSLVSWPEGPERYEAAVIDGILDELLIGDTGLVVLNARFTLEEIRWHPVDSSPRAFTLAARAAARAILARDELPGNVVPAG